MRLISHAAVLAAAACILSAALSWLSIQVSTKLGLIAEPRSDRWHRNTTPNTGGIAIFLSCGLVFLANGRGPYTWIATAALGIVVLGFIDDRVRLRPVIKFMGQSLAVLAVIAGGVIFHATTSEPLNIILTFLWIVAVTNAFNLIDNMDGLCAGVTIIICGFRFWSALQMNNASGAAVLAILAGGFLGFLLFNYKPAKIFMGDTGSMFAGFTLASLAIATPAPQTRVFLSAILCPLLTFLYPLFDTVLVSVLRKMAGRPISVGGRDHSSHRLASLGLKEQRVVWLLWVLTAMGSAAGLLTYSMPVGVLVVAFFLSLATTIFGIFLASLPGYELPQTAIMSGSWIRNYIPTLRAGMIVLLDTLIAGVSLFASFLLKWENDFSGTPVSELLAALPIVMACQAAICLAFRIFNLDWRWTGIHDVFILGRCVLVSSGLSVLAGWAIGLRQYSLGVICLYALLLFLSMSGTRILLPLLWRLLGSSQNGRRAAVLNIAQSAELLILMLQRDKNLDAQPVLILDADPASDGTRIYGIPVHCARNNPMVILREASVHVLILSTSNNCLTPTHVQVIEACEALGIPILQFEWHLSPLVSSPQSSHPSLIGI